MTAAEHQERFANWMRDYRAILYRVVNAFALGDDRNDLRQEVTLALWHGAPAFLGQCQPSTFVYRVAHNAALTWRRKERKHERRRAVATEIDWMVRPEIGRGRSDTPERLEALYGALHTLPPIDRSLILLSLDGLEYRDIAEIHGISESNVGARLTRTRQRLTTLLHTAQTHEARLPD
jgi:RNA polymerase sigma-70 factor (ECF subfamily)